MQPKDYEASLVDIGLLHDNQLSLSEKYHTEYERDPIGRGKEVRTLALTGDISLRTSYESFLARHAKLYV